MLLTGKMEMTIDKGIGKDQNCTLPKRKDD